MKTTFANFTISEYKKHGFEFIGIFDNGSISYRFDFKKGEYVSKFVCLKEWATEELEEGVWAESISSIAAWANEKADEKAKHAKLIELKWKPILETEGLPHVKDAHKRKVTPLDL